MDVDLDIFEISKCVNFGSFAKNHMLYIRYFMFRIMRLPTILH